MITQWQSRSKTGAFKPSQKLQPPSQPQQQKGLENKELHQTIPLYAVPLKSNVWTKNYSLICTLYKFGSDQAVL